MKRPQCTNSISSVRLLERGLDVLIQTLQGLRHELALNSEIEVHIHLQD
jgi:hypothetical protein